MNNEKQKQTHTTYYLKNDLWQSSESEEDEEQETKDLQQDNCSIPKKFLKQELPYKILKAKKNMKNTVFKNQYGAQTQIETEQPNSKKKTRKPQTPYAKNDVNCQICLSNRQEICKRDKIRNPEFFGCIDCQFLCCRKCFDSLRDSSNYSWKCPSCRKDNSNILVSDLKLCGRNNQQFQRLLQQDQVQSIDQGAEGKRFIKSILSKKKSQNEKTSENKSLLNKRGNNNNEKISIEENPNPVKEETQSQDLIQRRIQTENFLNQLDLIINTSRLLQLNLKESCLLAGTDSQIFPPKIAIDSSNPNLNPNLNPNPNPNQNQNPRIKKTESKQKNRQVRFNIERDFDLQESRSKINIEKEQLQIKPVY